MQDTFTFARSAVVPEPALDYGEDAPSLEAQLLARQSYSLHIKNVDEAGISLLWSFPPANPGDCSAWVSLAPSATVHDAAARMKYKLITKNKMFGECKFSLAEIMKLRDGKYAFGMLATMDGEQLTLAVTPPFSKLDGQIEPELQEEAGGQEEVGGGYADAYGGAATSASQGVDDDGYDEPLCGRNRNRNRNDDGYDEPLSDEDGSGAHDGISHDTGDVTMGDASAEEEEEEGKQSRKPSGRTLVPRPRGRAPRGRDGAPRAWDAARGGWHEANGVAGADEGDEADEADEADEGDEGDDSRMIDDCPEEVPTTARAAAAAEAAAAEAAAAEAAAAEAAAAAAPRSRKSALLGRDESAVPKKKAAAALALAAANASNERRDERRSSTARWTCCLDDAAFQSVAVAIVASLRRWGPLPSRAMLPQVREASPRPAAAAPRPPAFRASLAC